MSYRGFMAKCGLEASDRLGSPHLQFPLPGIQKPLNRAWPWAVACEIYVREMGSQALPGPKHLLHGMDHSIPHPSIQEGLSCGEKETLFLRCSGGREEKPGVKGQDRY